VWIGAAALLLVVVGVVALVSSSEAVPRGGLLSPRTGLQASDGGVVATKYKQVIGAATQVRSAMDKMDEVAYFKSTAALKQRYKELETLVPAEHIDKRSLSSLAFGETELWWSWPWTWSWKTWKWTNAPKKAETFLNRTSHFFTNEATAVDKDVTADEKSAITDVQDTGKALEATAKYAETHTVTQDEEAAAAFVSKHKDWAKNKLCEMAAAEIFDDSVNALTAAAVTGLCISTICPDIASAVDTIGAGPTDVIADAVAVAVGAYCVTGCALSVDTAETVVASEGLKLASGKGINALSASLCKEIHCGPISNSSSNT